MQISPFTPNQMNFRGLIHCPEASISKAESEYIVNNNDMFVSSESISSIGESSSNSYASEIRMNNGDTIYTHFSPEKVAKAKADVDGTNKIYTMA